MHPGKDGRHQLYLMCDELDPTLAELRRRGVTVRPEIHHERWGNLATIVLPGGGEVGVYEPLHPRPEPG